MIFVLTHSTIVYSETLKKFRVLFENTLFLVSYLVIVIYKKPLLSS